ncbi:hypothetical protein Gotur_030538, partial [Gossypium turneri]
MFTGYLVGYFAFRTLFNYSPIMVLLAANAPYKQIRSIWIESTFNTRPRLISLFSGSNFVFTSLKTREKNSDGGILRLVFGMFLETFLLIIKTSEPNLKS